MAEIAFALDQGEHGMFFWRRAKGFVLGLSANVGFIRLDDFIGPAEGAALRVPRRLAKSME